MTKLFLFALTVSILFINADCKSDPVIPIEDITPGRRDYVWTVDTLKLPYGDVFTPTRIWGSTPNDVWITGFGDAGDLLWHFDGVRWIRDSTRYLISPSALWGTANNNIWLGNSNGAFWRYDGTRWNKFSEHKINGFDRIVIQGIYGTVSNDLWAVGFADQFNGGTKYIGIIMHFNGTQWEFTQTPEIKSGFKDVFKQKLTELLFIGGGGYDTTGYIYKIFKYDYKTISLINSNNESGSSIYMVNDKIYFVIGQKIYKYENNKMESWKDLSNTNFVGVMNGRTEKDFFTYTSGDFITWGIGHYDGSNFQTIYTLPPNFRISGMMVFEKTVFFQSYSTSSNINIVVHGVLQE